MAGTAGLLGRSAEVWRARSLDCLGSSPPLRPLAPDRESVAVFDPPPAPSPQPRLAGLVIMPAPNPIRLASPASAFRCYCSRPSSTPSVLCRHRSIRRATGSMSAIPVAFNAAAAANTARAASPKRVFVQPLQRNARALLCSPTARMPVTTAVVVRMKLSAEHMTGVAGFLPTASPTRPAPKAGATRWPACWRSPPPRCCAERAVTRPSASGPRHSTPRRWRVFAAACAMANVSALRPASCAMC